MAVNVLNTNVRGLISSIDTKNKIATIQLDYKLDSLLRENENLLYNILCNHTPIYTDEKSFHNIFFDAIIPENMIIDIHDKTPEGIFDILSAEMSVYFDLAETQSEISESIYIAQNIRSIDFTQRYIFVKELQKMISDRETLLKPYD